jgi:uncharacterized protein YeaO (DUF488 family)
MIYTASFLTHDQFQGRKFSIANRQPTKFKDNPFSVIKALQPGNIVAKYKARQISQEEYTRRYLEQLDRNVDLLWRMVNSALSEEGPIVLLCWEEEGDFCHRRILADYLVKVMGVDAAVVEVH